MTHEVEPDKNFDVAIVARLTDARAQQRREAAATATARALRTRTEQSLPIRQTAAEAAAATMRADAQKIAQTLRHAGGQTPAEGHLLEGSSIEDPSRRVKGYEFQRRRLFRSEETVFRQTHEEIDAWCITAEQWSELGGGGSGDRDSVTRHGIRGLALTAGGSILHYIAESRLSLQPIHIAGLRILIHDNPVTINELAPIEHARDDGTYDTAVIEQWRNQLLDIL